jgi:hypothetical protein
MNKRGLLREQIETFEKTENQLEGFYSEIDKLLKKSPNDTVNIFKLNLINTVLEKANSILGENRPFTNFQEFDLDQTPTNSDVCTILSQYIECMDHFKSDNVEGFGDVWYWISNGEKSDIRASTPKKVKKTKK